MIVLANGAKVIGQVDTGTDDGIIILAQFRDHGLVCWMADRNEPAHCYGGHYSTEAMPRFLAQIERYHG